MNFYPLTRVGDLCKLVNGKAFKPEDWSNEGQPIIRIQNLNDSERPFNYWSGPLTGQVRIKGDDVLLAWSGTPGTSFGAHIWKGPAGILNQHIFRVDLDERKVTKEWWVRAVNSRLVRLIEQAHGGVGLKHVTRGMVDDLEIPLPSLSEQRRIAAILDEAGRLRGLRQSGLARLVSIEEAIFHELFGNPIRNTKNWPQRLLGDVSTIERGKFSPRPRNDPSYYTGQYPFIQTGDISSSGGVLRKWTQTLNEKGKAVSRCFPPGTVVIAIVGATLGVTAILEVEVYCPDSVIGIQPKKEASTSEYLERLLRIWRPIFVSQAPDTARANMNLESLRPLRIPLPPIDLQRQFSARMATIESLRTSYLTSLARLDALFASLQHRAFRGELTSKDFERQLAIAS